MTAFCSVTRLLNKWITKWYAQYAEQRNASKETQPDGFNKFYMPYSLHVVLQCIIEHKITLYYN